MKLVTYDDGRVGRVEGERVVELDVPDMRRYFELAGEVGETGRSAPSRDMVMHLAEQLDLPLRERNQMLMAAGYAPVYQERALDTAPMAVIRDAVRQVLLGHEPYPAIAVDRQWNLVDGNAALVTDVDQVHGPLLREVGVGNDHLLHALLG